MSYNIPRAVTVRTVGLFYHSCFSPQTEPSCWECQWVYFIVQTITFLYLIHLAQFITSSDVVLPQYNLPRICCTYTSHTGIIQFRKKSDMRKCSDTQTKSFTNFEDTAGILEFCDFFLLKFWKFYTDWNKFCDFLKIFLYIFAILVFFLPILDIHNYHHHALFVAICGPPKSVHGKFLIFLMSCKKISILNVFDSSPDYVENSSWKG